MAVFRIYVEKKSQYAVEAKSVFNDIKTALGISELKQIRIINRYDCEKISKADFVLATPTVFSEPAVDFVYSSLPQLKSNERVFAVRNNFV